ncbi:MAG TPA: heterodisulfide reductase-related iron-sulfur binding cluster [Gaiella sp.]|uniref:(Fe-S)-binding protein n=1 Tax=Gaiella sp. TaxID=2663207 RepID=UPI002D7FC509|nr:heterodisulfide reductase-related iron-sulfur binding cluster [Gaiella sp.]HET9289186.1 heterodisulfide reductase-related iron-sulfur binding cluster [Gaiella sp.]
MIEELTRACVHCGFCLPTCPTYVLWSEEMDSPRGRIQLMEKTAQGTLRLSPTVVEHFDRCLGCMACVSSCPSGVRYDRLIEETRHVVETEHRRPRAERLQRRLLFATLPYPRRMRWALRLAPLGRVLPAPAWARPMLELAPRWRSSERPAAVTPARDGSTRAAPRVGLLTGCVQSVVFGEVNAATARVLAAGGFEVVAPAQGCCGALSAHAGRADESARLTARLQRSFAGLDTIVVNASGCGSHLKDRDLPALDLTEALADAEFPVLHPLDLRVAYQDSCHLRHAQRLPAAWRPLLEQIPGLSVVEPAEQDICCGSAGIYNVTQPLAARDLGDRKAARVLATEADAYASANPGCLVQVAQALGRAGTPLPALHPVELLDASLRGVPATDLLARARR